MGHTALRQNGKSLDSLTDKMRRFTLEYRLDYNGKAAAIRAGYPAKTAAVRASKLLKHPVIKAFLGKQERLDAEKLGLTRERILLELACLALRDPIDLCDEDGMIRIDDLRKLPSQIRRCIDGIKVKQTTDSDGNMSQMAELKLAPKTPAVELALKHFGLLMPEKHELLVSPGFDWDSLSKPPKDADVIEQCLALEEEKGASDGS